MKILIMVKVEFKLKDVIVEVNLQEIMMLKLITHIN
jgi:hypothetical protein